MSDSFIDDQGLIDLEYTRNLRRRMVDEIILNSKGKIPEDKSDREALFRAIDGLDVQVLSKARIKAQDKSNQAANSIAGSIAELLKAKKRNKSVVIEREEEVPSLPKDVTVVPVPGETDTNPEQLNFDSFMAKKPDIE